jgi:hypothetical protein
MQDPMKHS